MGQTGWKESECLQRLVVPYVLLRIRGGSRNTGLNPYLSFAGTKRYAN